MGTCVAAPDLELEAGVAPEVGVVGLRVVGQHPLDQDPLLGIPGERPAEEGGAVFLALAWQDLAVGEPGVVVDRDV
jgi:hypothetical protein